MRERIVQMEPLIVATRHEFNIILHEARECGQTDDSAEQTPEMRALLQHINTIRPSLIILPADIALVQHDLDALTARMPPPSGDDDDRSRAYAQMRDEKQAKLQQKAEELALIRQQYATMSQEMAERFPLAYRKNVRRRDLNDRSDDMESQLDIYEAQLQWLRYFEQDLQILYPPPAYHHHRYTGLERRRALDTVLMFKQPRLESFRWVYAGIEVPRAELRELWDLGERLRSRSPPPHRAFNAG